jgi:hypothetical protein
VTYGQNRPRSIGLKRGDVLDRRLWQHEGFVTGEVPVYLPCRWCGAPQRADRLDLLREHAAVCTQRPKGGVMTPTRTGTVISAHVGDLALVVIAIFVVLADFNGRG